MARRRRVEQTSWSRARVQVTTINYTGRRSRRAALPTCWLRLPPLEWAGRRRRSLPRMRTHAHYAVPIYTHALRPIARNDRRTDGRTTTLDVFGRRRDDVPVGSFITSRVYVFAVGKFLSFFYPTHGLGQLVGLWDWWGEGGRRATVCFDFLRPHAKDGANDDGGGGGGGAGNALYTAEARPATRRAPTQRSRR